MFDKLPGLGKAFGRPDKPEPATLIDYDGPAGGAAPSFTLDGIRFTLDAQPGGQATPEHEVVRTAEGGVEIRLQEGAADPTFATNAKVTYAADLPETTKRVGLDYSYGEDLDRPTPSFSNQQAFFRRDPDARDPDSSAGAVKSQFLIGSDAANPNSAFAGNIARQFNDGTTDAFVNNAGYPTSGQLNLVQHDDGRVQTTTVAEGAGAVTNNVDLDPEDAIDDFALDQLLLQAETFQDDASFQAQFGDAGQAFGFADLQVTTAGPDLVGQPGNAGDDGGMGLA